MCAKTGRPKAENPKGIRLAVRVDQETLDKLDEVSKAESQTRAETIRKGIEIQYERVHNKK